jgi:spore maturation protein CgeB
MKIQFLIKYYDGFIDSLNQNIDSKLSYNEFYNIVIEESINLLTPFVKYFKVLGHETHLIIPNFEILQKKWCLENGIEFSDKWMIDVAEEQIKAFKPDILFLNSNFEYFGSFLENINPYVNKTCAWISCPFDKNLDLKNINHVFTLFKPHYDFFKNKNISTTLTHAAFDDEILKDIKGYPKYDFTFIGGIGKYHKQREKDLKKLIQHTPIKIWGYGYRSKNPIKDIIKQIKNGFVYSKVYQGEAWGKDMLQILAQSKITFNSHGDIAQGHAVNMRIFEATGVGTLLLTEYSKGINDFFEPDKEVICYKDIEDAIQKVKYYLKHEDERIKISKAGQKRTIENFTYKKLAIKYIAIFNELLNDNEK